MEYQRVNAVVGVFRIAITRECTLLPPPLQLWEHVLHVRMVAHVRWRAPQKSLVSALPPTLGSTVKSLWSLAALMTSALLFILPLSPSSVLMRVISSI